MTRRSYYGRSYYDTEAERYDRTRGGDARAAEAADAVTRLLPDSARLVLDMAGGTGIVGARLNSAGRRVLSVDRSAGMAAIAAARLPGQVVLGDATRLPLATGSVDAVTAIWLLHLLDEPTSAAVIAAAARVLRPGGTLVTTVDKAASHHAGDDDVAALLGPAWHADRGTPTDGIARVTALAAEHGLTLSGRTTFTGVGQGRTPTGWRRHIADPNSGWAPARLAELDAALAALPDPDRARSAPVYHLVALIG